MQKELPRGVLKESPHDFMVQERVFLEGLNEGTTSVEVPFHKSSHISGKADVAPFTLFELTKYNMTHRSAVREIMRQLNVAMDAISTHGMHDRYALTSQLAVVFGPFTPHFEHPSMALNQIAPATEPLKLGRNAGNHFDILIRSQAEHIEIDRMRELPNLFGPQRIGWEWQCDIGRMLIEGDFAGAGRLLMRSSSSATKAQLQRALIKAKGDWKAAWLHDRMKFDCKFQVMRWQSLLWNRLVEDQFEQGMTDAIPLWTPEYSELYARYWVPSQLDPDIVHRLHTYDRRTVMRPSNIVWDRKGEYWRMRFDLRSGEYATVALAKIFDLREPTRH